MGIAAIRSLSLRHRPGRLCWLILALCWSGLSGASERPRIDVPSVRALNIDDAVLEVVVAGLEEPWAFEFISGDTVLVTERRGRLLLVSLVDGSRREIAGLGPVASNRQQTGLLDVALHPEFADNQRIYVSYTESDASGEYFATVLDTAILGAEALLDRRRLLTALPHAWSPSNFGGAIEFGADGRLYLSIGDRSEPMTAQDGRLLQGKILRLTDDGQVPPDNPFVDDPAVDDRIWALGVRNPQGLFFDPVRGLLFEAEHGPMGGDEVNVIRARANYGWPLISYGRNYTVEHLGLSGEASSPQLDFHLATAPPVQIGAHTRQPGLEQPLYYYTPSTAISPITVIRGAMFPEWDGHLLVGALKGRHLSKIDYDGATVRSEERFLTEANARVRDVKVDADGAIWILAQDGRLLRLYRDPALRASDPAPRDPGAAAYEMVCRACHERGAGGAPRPDQPADWREVPVDQRELLYQRVIEGWRGMPERGSCYRCSDQLLRQAVDHMLDRLAQAQRPAPEEADQPD